MHYSSTPEFCNLFPSFVVFFVIFFLHSIPTVSTHVQLLLESGSNLPAVASVVTIPQRPILASTISEKDGHFSFVTRSSKALNYRGGRGTSSR